MSVTPIRPRPPFVAYPVEARLALSVPLVAAQAECGFPSPADDYLEGCPRFQRATDRETAGLIALFLEWLS